MEAFTHNNFQITIDLFTFQNKTMLGNKGVDTSYI